MNHTIDQISIFPILAEDHNNGKTYRFTHVAGPGDKRPHHKIKIHNLKLRFWAIWPAEHAVGLG
jgi:hypothetical protein